MKKLIYITLTLAFLCGINRDASAWVNDNPGNSVVDDAQKGNYVFFRLDYLYKDIFLVFYGPASRAGDEVDVKIYHGGTGTLLRQEYFTAHGNGTYEKFSIDDLEAGPYSIVVTSDKYNLSQPFILE